MLFDRKRINRITKWFAIIFAAIFALSGIVLGVGSTTGNVFAGCASSNSGISANSSVQDKEAYYQGLIKKNPKDTTSMLALANLYAGDDVKRYDDAVNWLNRYLALDPQDNDVRLRIASIDITDRHNYQDAITVLNQVTASDPKNANAFLLLGQAAKSAGQNQQAILAWNQYLQLVPNSEYAATLKDQIAQLSEQPAAPAATTPAP